MGRACALLGYFPASIYMFCGNFPVQVHRIENHSSHQQGADDPVDCRPASFASVFCEVALIAGLVARPSAQLSAIVLNPASLTVAGKTNTAVPMMDRRSLCLRQRCGALAGYFDCPAKPYGLPENNPPTQFILTNYVDILNLDKISSEVHFGI